MTWLFGAGVAHPTSNPPLIQRRYGCYTRKYGSVTSREPERGPEWRQQNVLNRP